MKHIVDMCPLTKSEMQFVIKVILASDCPGAYYFDAAYWCGMVWFVFS